MAHFNTFHVWDDFFQDMQARLSSKVRLAKDLAKDCKVQKK